MATLDVFSADAFSLRSLTASINDLPYVPSMLGASGIFDEKGMPTTTAQIERMGNVLILVPNKPRGAPPTIPPTARRTLIPINCTHLPETRTVMADEVQGVRAFGTESELEGVQSVVNQKLTEMRRNIDATLEWQRIGALKGQILDADATTVLLDLYATFGVTQQVVAMALTTSTTEIAGKIEDALEYVETALGATPFGVMRAVCGGGFWRALMAHPMLKDTLKNWEAAVSLARDPRTPLVWGGVEWTRYRGSVGGVPFVGADDAYLYPDNVPGLFQTYFGPADYVETVNTIGLPYYAKQETLPLGKGIVIEAQSNPITICTRPNAVIKLTKV